MINTSQKFQNHAVAGLRLPTAEVGISFSKVFHGVFRLDYSKLNGPDIFPDSDSYNFWEHYDYEDMTRRLVRASVSRSVKFPYNVQSAIADIQLDNHDGYLTFSEDGSSSPVGDQILPKRPLRVRFGFKGSEYVPNFIGLTQKLPSYSGTYDEIAKWTAMDFLSELADEKLPNMVMLRDVRTGEVIERILTDLGLTPDMYELDPGANIIPFVYYEANKSVGNAFKELIQAENGYLWQDETGKIRFEERRENTPGNVIMEINDDDIISISPSREDGIVNSVNIQAEIREVKNFQQIFVSDNQNGYQATDPDQDAYRVPAGRTRELWLNLEDPAWELTAPVFNGSTDSSNFTAVKLDGTHVTSGVTATWQGFAKSVKVTLANSNDFPISIDFISIWGEPARMIGGQPIEYSAEDTDSVAKYGIKQMEITDNNCFGSIANLRNYANEILRAYSDYNPTISVKCKGNPALQLLDQLRVVSEGFTGDYRIIAITNTISGQGGLETSMTLKVLDGGSPFVVGRSILGATSAIR